MLTSFGKDTGKLNPSKAPGMNEEKCVTALQKAKAYLPCNPEVPPLNAYEKQWLDRHDVFYPATETAESLKEWCANAASVCTASLFEWRESSHK